MNGTMPSVGKSGLRPIRARDVATQAVIAVSEEMEVIRQRLASLYASATTDAAIEQEVGDCLHFVRQACKRLRKSSSELMQLPLPLEGDPD